jgi:hypothetical protein
VTPATPQILSRIQNLVHPATPWHRALWTISTHTGLREVLEYAEVGIESKTPNDGLTFAASRLTEQVGRDPGVGSSTERRELARLLSTIAGLQAKRFPEEATLERLRYWSDRIHQGYFDRWIEAIETESLHLERSSRLLASALLDSGFSQQWVVDTSTRGGSETPVVALERTLTMARDLVSGPLPEYEICIPLDSAPEPLVLWRNFLDAAGVSSWIENCGVRIPEETSLDKRQGGLLTTVRALDPHSAVEVARQLLRSGLARHAVSGRTLVRPRDLGWALVRGEQEPIQIHDSRRSIAVPNLKREDAKSQWSDAMANAIELVSAMEETNPTTVVSAGWAAVEGLLVRGGERGGGGRESNPPDGDRPSQPL